MPSLRLTKTPLGRLLDNQRRPYFLWDEDIDVDEFERRLHSDDDRVRGYYLGKLMRQAKPDDVFHFVTAEEIRRDWSHLVPYLGKTRPMWTWLLDFWARRGLA